MFHLFSLSVQLPTNRHGKNITKSLLESEYYICVFRNPKCMQRLHRLRRKSNPLAFYFAMAESLLLSSSPSTAASRSLGPSSSPFCPSPRSALPRLPRRHHPLPSASIAGSSISPVSRLNTPIFVSAAGEAAWSGVEEASLPEDRLDDGGGGPRSVELVPILSESQFDRVIAEVQQAEESVIMLWFGSGPCFSYFLGICVF